MSRAHRRRQLREDTNTRLDTRVEDSKGGAPKDRSQAKVFQGLILMDLQIFGISSVPFLQDLLLHYGAYIKGLVASARLGRAPKEEETEVRPLQQFNM